MGSDKKIPTVVSVNISPGGIPKLPVPGVYVRTAGLVGDGHNHQKHYRLYQAVSLQNIEMLEELSREGYPLRPGTTGENVTLRHLDVNGLPLGTRLTFPSGLTVEVTKVRTACYVLDSIDPSLKDNVDGRLGMYAQVNREGEIRCGDTVSVNLPQHAGISNDLS